MLLHRSASSTAPPAPRKKAHDITVATTDYNIKARVIMLRTAVAAAVEETTANINYGRIVRTTAVARQVKTRRTTSSTLMGILPRTTATVTPAAAQISVSSQDGGWGSENKAWSLFAGLAALGGLALLSDQHEVRQHTNSGTIFGYDSINMSHTVSYII